MAEEDLKYKILQLKKELHNVSSENYLFKVKIRKLQSDVDNKNKQIECLLDPKKSANVRKIISERGASMMINLKQRNSELHDIITNKDTLIRKLQHELQTTKLYSAKDTAVKNGEVKHIPVKTNRECHIKETNSNTDKKFRSRSLSCTPTPKECYFKSASDIQMEYVQLAQNLQKIRSANALTKNCVFKRSLPQNLLVHKSQNFVKDNTITKPIIEKNSNNKIENIVTEMEKMKETILHLSSEQENTKKLLKDKNRNIEILEKKVKNLQKCKFTRPLNTKTSHSNLKSNYDSQLKINNNLNNMVQIQNSEESDNKNESGKVSEDEENDEYTENDNDDDADVETGDSR